MMKRTAALTVLGLTWVLPTHAGTLKCPPDSVKVGNACIDTYEATVWQIPPSNTSLVKKVQQGKATLTDLTSDGATQLQVSPSCLPSAPGNFPFDGNWTPEPGSNPPSPGVYAVSIPGVPPSGCMSWFQANEACGLSGKRLIRNDEWQRAAAGTPDPGSADDGSTTCATNSAGPANTGSRGNCKSSWGVFDMVGNVDEWVADWADRADTGCTTWGGLMADDNSCFGGDGSGAFKAFNQFPGAMMRGGSWFSSTFAGVFSVDAAARPPSENNNIGFRCAR